MQGNVVFAFVLFEVELCLLADSRHHGGMLEALPHHVDGHGSRVGHLLIEEAVVAQFVEDNLVGGEVVDVLKCRSVGGRDAGQLIDGEEECAFAELVAVGTVGHVAYGRDG